MNNPPVKASVRNMAGSISKVGIRVIRDKLHREGSLVDDAKYDERMSICKACPQYRSDGRCAECGCIMRLKTKFKFVKCPIGKWDEEKKSI